MQDVALIILAIVSKSIVFENRPPVGPLLRFIFLYSFFFWWTTYNMVVKEGDKLPNYSSDTMLRCQGT